MSLRNSVAHPECSPACLIQCVSSNRAQTSAFSFFFFFFSRNVARSIHYLLNLKICVCTELTPKGTTSARAEHHGLAGNAGPFRGSQRVPLCILLSLIFFTAGQPSPLLCCKAQESSLHFVLSALSRTWDLLVKDGTSSATNGGLTVKDGMSKPTYGGAV